MHPAPIFREKDPATLIDRIRAHPLGIVCVNGEAAPRVAHTPVLASIVNDVPRLRFHLSAHNPVTAGIARGLPVTIVFTGPSAYVSPDWYGSIPNQVPTWNYLSVEAEGTPVPTGDAGATEFLDDVSAWFEHRLLPKPPWTRSKMALGSFEAMLRGIRAFDLHPVRFEGITKLSQNKTPEVRAGVIDGLGDHPIADAMKRHDL